MRHKKIILLLLLTVISGMIFSGCGTVQETSDAEDMSESATVSTMEEESVGDTEEHDIESIDDEEADYSPETQTIPSDTEEETQSETEMLPSDSETESQADTIMIITVNDTELSAVMEDNSSVTALMEPLADGPLTIEMSDYGNMEKVGPIGTELPRNDEQTTTEAGDLILYQGNLIP